jgi:hypothetical protein
MDFPNCARRKYLGEIYSSYNPCLGCLVKISFFLLSDLTAHWPQKSDGEKFG